MANWIDSVRWNGRAGWQFFGLERTQIGWMRVALTPDEALTHRGVDVSSTPTRLLRPGTNVPLRVRALSAGERLLSSRSLIRAILPGARVSKMHQVYCFRYEGRAIYVPALLLIGALFGATRHLRNRVLEPDFVDGTVMAMTASSSSTTAVVRIDRSVHRTSLNPAILSRLAWLALVPEGRKCATSIYSAACNGQIDLWLPSSAALDAWVWGIEISGGVFAQELLSAQFDFDLPCENVEFSVLRRPSGKRRGADRSGR